MNTDPTIAEWEAQVLHGYALAASSALPERTPADKHRAATTPLRDRLAAALARIPAEAKSEGLRMATIWPMTSGRQRSKPQASAVADALRSLGWIRRRFYSDGTQPSGSYWFPPQTQPDGANAASKLRGTDQ
jgi:hypothetical protein